MTMSMEPMDTGPAMLPVRTFSPIVRTRKYVPTNSAMYLDKALCWYTCFGGACMVLALLLTEAVSAFAAPHPPRAP